MRSKKMLSHLLRKSVARIVFSGLLAASVWSTVFLNRPVKSAAGEPQLSVPGNSLTNQAAAKDFGKLPLSFESNEGQLDPAVKFLSHGPGYNLFLTAKGAVLTLERSGSRVSETKPMRLVALC